MLILNQFSNCIKSILLIYADIYNYLLLQWLYNVVVVVVVVIVVVAPANSLNHGDTNDKDKRLIIHRRRQLLKSFHTKWTYTQRSTVPNRLY